MYYLDDLSEGLRFELGHIKVTESSIIEFAEAYDPQPFHIDKTVAGAMFGGLIASGWHTASLGQRLLVEGFLNQVACMASPGVDQLRFVRPVFADTVLSGRLTILSTRASASKPDRGLVKLDLQLDNADGETVLGMIGMVIVARRPTGDLDPGGAAA